MLKAKVAQANARYDKLTGAAKAKEPHAEKLKLADVGVCPRKQPPAQQRQPIQIRWTSSPMEASPLAWKGPVSIWRHAESD